MGVAQPESSWVPNDRHLTRPRVDGVNTAAILRLLFGPARNLSGPTSRRILAHYALPFSETRVATSASAAAKHARAFGFPVKLSLAGPNLQSWMQPEWVIDNVESAASARRAYQALMARAQSIAQSNVAVGQNRDRHAVGVDVRPALARQCDLAFAFEVPKRSDGSLTATVHVGATQQRFLLPDAEQALITHIVQSAADTFDRKVLTAVITDTLARAAAFIWDWHGYVEHLTLAPIALPSEGLWIEDAAIKVSAGFASPRALLGRS